MASRGIPAPTRAPRRRRPPQRGRRRRLIARALPLLVIAVVAFVAGVTCASDPGAAERKLAQSFLGEWAHKDFKAMYGRLTTHARAATSLADFTAAYRAAAATATATAIRPGEVSGPVAGVIMAPVAARTRVWGTVRGRVRIPMRGSGDDARIAWRPAMAFPGLRRGERLHRKMELAPRGAILARDGSPLAKGPDRTAEDPAVAQEIVGSLEPLSAKDAAPQRAHGIDPGMQVGHNGLELALDAQLRGEPGGRLLAGKRVLARAKPVPGHSVTTTIDPGIERAAITALAGRSGGIAALKPSNGQILALAGLAFSTLQPPGSTFKMITATAALESGATKMDTTYPVTSGATINGQTISNDFGELCGGTFVESFAHSCNSVFAPLGAKVGAKKLVDTAEKYGFNEPPGIPGAATSEIPQAREMPEPNEVGSSAIGQGRVQATPLQMAEVAATIGADGMRAKPTLLLNAKPKRSRAVDKKVAHQVQQLMVAVVTSGTGTRAAIAGTQVAGKTGTAELANSTPGGDSPIDAWFAAFAPVEKPKIAAGAMFIDAPGDGGTVAAPAVRQVLAAAL